MVAFSLIIDYSNTTVNLKFAPRIQQSLNLTSYPIPSHVSFHLILDPLTYHLKAYAGKTVPRILDLYIQDCVSRPIRPSQLLNRLCR